MFALLLLSVPAFALTLEEAWSAAGERGVDSRLVREREIQAETTKMAAWSLVQPKLVAGASYTINEYPIVLDFAASLPPEFATFLGDVEPTVVNKERFLTWNASVVQPIFSGQALPLLRGAYRMVDGARAEASGLRDQIHAGVARAYYGALVAREGVRVAEQAVKNAASHAQLAQQAVDAGTAAPTEALQGQIALARAERELLGAREGQVAAEQALQTLTGRPLEGALSVPKPPSLPWSSVDAALDAALGRRPALAAAQAQADAATLQARATSLGWLPTLDGRFTYNYTENTGFTTDRTMWMVVLDARWTAWDGGYRISEQRKTQSQARMASLAVDKARRETEERVRTLWERHARAERAVVTVEKELELAQRNLTLAETAYGAGTLTFLQLEDARLGARAAQMARLAQVMDRDLAVYELLAVAGALR
jgi:outer membrane protein TolC